MDWRALSAAAFIISTAVLGAQKKDDKKQSDAQKKEILDIVKLVDGTSAGQPATNDFGLTWAHEDFLKATSNKEYIPFTLTFDTSEDREPEHHLVLARRREGHAAPRRR